MAGLYPDVPGPRIPMDKNGTLGLIMTSSYTSITSTLSSGDMTAVCDDRQSNSVDISFAGFCMLLPHKFNVVGIHVQGTMDAGTIQWSSDTTNGVDGTWTSTTKNTRQFSGDNPGSARSNIHSVSLSACRGLRFTCASSGRFLAAFHVYGSVTSGQNPDRLALWHPTTDTAITDGAYFDWDDVLQGATAMTKEFRIKNLSATLTANSVDLVTEDTRSGAVESFSGQLTFDVGGGGYNPGASLGNLAPGTISSKVTVKYTPTGTTDLSLWFSRFKVEAGSWV